MEHRVNGRVLALISQNVRKHGITLLHFDFYILHFDFKGVI